MFIDTKHYFINLAQVSFMGTAYDGLEKDHGGDPNYSLFIYMLQEGSDPIMLRDGFDSEEHLEAFKHALLRHCGTMGLATDDDLDYIFTTTKQ